MNTNGSSFELIMQELMNQKQILEDLEAENLDLRRQLAGLRAGRGIVVEILGERFSLSEEPLSAETSPENSSLELAVPAGDSPATSDIEASTTPIPEALLAEPDQEEGSEEEVAAPAATAPAFLEEMLLEEFATASTRQMAVWTNSAPKPPVVDEEEKAVLRRELSDSFLLE